MCGIAGIVETGAHGVDAARVQTMGERLLHRGPDDFGYLGWWPDGRLVCTRDAAELTGARVALAHRRLSIIDVGEGGWQPMCSKDGAWGIVFNGEIYNYVELRAELEEAGWCFRSRSDTEVLLAACATWGQRALARLVGMFAFALLDRAGERLWLARDFAGMKPLFTTTWHGGFAFASEIKALLDLPAVSRRADPVALRAYLEEGLVDHAGHTFFKDVRRVPAAHWLELPLATPVPTAARRYWSLPARREGDVTMQAAAEELHERLFDSVRLHMRSDVPVGAALSGGIDSSAIVAGMRAAGGADSELHTFTYVAADSALDEERWADLVAAKFGARAHKTRDDYQHAGAALAGILQAQDEPFGSTSILAQWSVFALVRSKGIKVVLDGQGADEMFAGYRPFQAARVAELLRAARPLAAWQLAGASARLPGESPLRTLLRVLAGLLPREVTRRLDRVRRRRSALGPVLRRGWFERHGVEGVPGDAGDRGSLDSALRDAFERSSLPALLRYEDRNSMTHSVESRLPFLTPALVELAFSLPAELLIGADGVSKAVLREALGGSVPRAVLERRDKIGFAASSGLLHGPLSGWTDGVLDGETARACPLLDHHALRRLAGTARAGDEQSQRGLWRLLNVLSWSEQQAVVYQ